MFCQIVLAVVDLQLCQIVVLVVVQADLNDYFHSDFIIAQFSLTRGIFALARLDFDVKKIYFKLAS